MNDSQPVYFQYDDTFEGLLTAVFDAFYKKLRPDKIVGRQADIPLFTTVCEVVADEEKADRVLRALRAKLSASALQMLTVCFLSESDEVATHAFNYICKSVAAAKSIELNFADADVLALSKVYKKVQREAERMRQFVRFQKTVDGLFFACMKPQYNVLPLVSEFFEDRFADQQWVIYDVEREYGLYYDLKKTETIRFDNLRVSPDTGRLSPDQMDASEQAFQDLWRRYFQSAAIKERINPRLQRQHLPVRFWKYLTEKQC